MDNLPTYTAEASRHANTNSVSPDYEHYAPMNSVRTLQLLQVDRKHQNFSFPPETSHFNYSIRVNDSTGLIKKPDLIIARESGTLEKVGEGRFEKYSQGTMIKYAESGKTHDLKLESSLSQRFVVTASGIALWWWQPSQRNKDVAEVVTSDNELIAQFTYSGEHVLFGRDVKDNTVLGVLEVDEQHAAQRAVLDELVSITAVLVERARRRGRNLRGYEGTGPRASLAAGFSGGIVNGPAG
ncbi:hypothetical protein ACLMJK_000264 [Lecanora helva]